MPLMLSHHDLPLRASRAVIAHVCNTQYRGTTGGTQHAAAALISYVRSIFRRFKITRLENQDIFTAIKG